MIHGHDFKQPNYPAVYFFIITSFLNPYGEIFSMQPKEKLNNEIPCRQLGKLFFGFFTRSQVTLGQVFFTFSEYFINIFFCVL